MDETITYGSTSLQQYTLDEKNDCSLALSNPKSIVFLAFLFKEHDQQKIHGRTVHIAEDERSTMVTGPDDV